jgi:NTP pyrophosphatase (non-canonical NTP hydrolase)
MNKEEILRITQEECAEVIQAISKIFRFGMDEVYDNQSNRQRLTSELGDLQCMIDLIKETKLVSTHELDEAVRSKRVRLEKWSTVFLQREEETVQ